MPFANNKGADQPAHPHSLISASVVYCLDSIMSSFYSQNCMPPSHFGIMCQYGLAFDLKINVGHCDLYFMLQ